MYKIIKKTEKTGGSEIVKGKLLYVQDKSLKLDNEVIYQGNISWFKTQNDLVFLVDNFKTGILINLNNKLKKEYPNLNSLSLFINDNEVIYSHNSEDYLTQYKAKFNLKTNKKEWNIKSYFTNPFSVNNELYGNNKEFIYKIDLEKGNPLWQFSFSPLGTYTTPQGKKKPYEVQKFIGVWQKELLVLLSNFRFLALHIKTGKCSKDLSVKDYFGGVDGNYLSNSGIHIDQKNSRMIWLSGTTLFHIDLSNFQLKTIKNYWHVPQKEKWRFMSSTLRGNYLYFTGDKGLEYVVATRIGVMNIETGEILWQQQLQKTGGLPNAPQVTEDKLYVHTVNGQLYIFEKEEHDSTDLQSVH